MAAAELLERWGWYQLPAHKSPVEPWQSAGAKPAALH